jgi:hypothetical protein
VRRGIVTLILGALVLAGVLVLVDPVIRSQRTTARAGCGKVIVEKPVVLVSNDAPFHFGTEMRQVPGVARRRLLGSWSFDPSGAVGPVRVTNGGLVNADCRIGP